MVKVVYCPKCGNRLLKQIEPVNGRIQIPCPGCRSSLVLTFENGTLTAYILMDEGDVNSVQNQS